MKKGYIAAIISLVAILLTAGAVLIFLSGKEKPQLAIDFTLPAVSGETISLSDYRGKVPVVVTFWASWCGDCHEEIPYLYEVASEYNDSEVIFLMVNSTSGVRETEEAAIAYLNDNGFDFNYVLLDREGEACSAYEVNFIPTTLFVNRDGYIVKRYNDVISEKVLRREVASILKK